MAKRVAAAVALLLAILGNIRFGCRVEVNGRQLDGVYSYRQVSECMECAGELADELLSSEAVIPSPALRCRLCLSVPHGDETALREALLLSCEGVQRLWSVSAKGVKLGYVEDGNLLRARLEAHIEAVRPSGSLYGAYSGDIGIKQVFTAGMSVTEQDDMVKLICGAAPIMYYTGETGMVIG